MRGEIRVRRGGHAHGSRGALRCRAPRPLVGCTGQRLFPWPDGAGHGDSARVTADHGLPSRHPGTRERRLAAVVGAPARGAFHDALFPLRAGNWLADLAPSTSGPPARLPDRHPVPTDLRVPSRRPAHTPHRPHPSPALPVEPRTPPPPPRIPCLAGACAAALAAASRTSRTTSDNYVQHGHLGDSLRVDFLETAPSTLRAMTRLERLSCRPWRSNSAHG